MLLMIFRLLIKKKYIRRGWRVFFRFIRYEVGDETKREPNNNNNNPRHNPKK